jgi:CheY-like chemotaxis protein
LYYVVPKSEGFEVAFSLINDNKLKILFEKTNSENKGGLRFKKKSKLNTCILCEDKFKATSTVKTPEMTQEILYKLSEILGIKIKFMEYEDKKEDKYLTIILPFVFDEDNDLLDSDINELPEDNYGQIPYLEEVAERNILYENNKKSEFDAIKVAKTNELISNNKASNDNTSSTKVNKRNSNNKKGSGHTFNLNFYKISPDRKASFLCEEVEEKNSSEEDVSSCQEEDKKENENSKINYLNNPSKNTNTINNTNLINNISHSSISKSSLNNGVVSIQSNSQKLPISKSKTPLSDKNAQFKNFKDLSNNYLNEIQNDNNNSRDIFNKDIPNIKFNTNVKIKRNALSVIHQKYSNLEKLKLRGVEILKENESENKKENDNKSLSEESAHDSIDNNLKDKKSITVEIDSDNYIEFENEEEDLDYEANNNKNNNNDNNNKRNNINNIKTNSPNKKSKRNNSVLLNVNYMNSNNNSPNKDKEIKKKNISNKTSTKTLNYKNSDKDSLFKIPETKDKKTPNQSPTIKLRKGLSKKNINESSCNCKDILLVDDDEFICKTFKNIIKKFKLEADCAENGQECLNMIIEKQKKNCQCAKNKYKIILMDITMPVMDGIEAAKNIQKMIDENKLYDTLKIIFISAHVNLDLRTVLSGIKCAKDYYAKPISADRYKSLLDKYYYPK